MIELTEDTVQEFIKEGSVAIKIWDDGCPFCNEFAPIFESISKQFPDVKFASFKIPRNNPSAFRDFVKMKQSVPATVLFNDGKLVNIAMGRLFEPALKKFIETGEIEKPKQPTPQEFAARASLTELEASLWQVSNQIVTMQGTFDIFKAEWDRRLQEKLG